MLMYSDEVAEWLRRWTANPLGSARVGSNPIFVVTHFFTVHLATWLAQQSTIRDHRKSLQKPQNEQN